MSAAPGPSAPSAPPQPVAEPRSQTAAASARASAGAGAATAAIPTPRPSFAEIRLDSVGPFSDLPSEVHDLLTEVARIEALSKDEEVSEFGAALVLQGDAAVCATIVDTPAYRAPRGSLIPARGSLADGTAMRIVAGSNGARVAVWNQAVLDMALKSCPWVRDELAAMADRLQGFAGLTMGPLGEIDEASRSHVVERMSARSLGPHELFATQGDKLAWLAVVGAGLLELCKGDPARVTGEVGPGDFLFPGIVVRDLPVPTTVRAGAGGAVILVGDQALAREILTGAPPLLQILS